jgi:hypothetical protein
VHHLARRLCRRLAPAVINILSLRDNHARDHGFYQYPVPTGQIRDKPPTPSILLTKHSPQSTDLYYFACKFEQISPKPSVRYNDFSTRAAAGNVSDRLLRWWQMTFLTRQYYHHYPHFAFFIRQYYHHHPHFAFFTRQYYRHNPHFAIFTRQYYRHNPHLAFFARRFWSPA